MRPAPGAEVAGRLALLLSEGGTMGRPITSSSPGARSRRRCGARLVLVRSAALLLTLLFAAGAEAAKPGTLLYAKHIGAGLKSGAFASAIAAGPKGVTALAGWQVKSGTVYPMVAKYTSAGKRVWLKRHTKAGTGRAADVAFDRSGNVYVAATVKYGTSDDIVVLKYSASGALRWTTKPYDGGEKGADEAEKLAVDAKGNVVVLGQSERAGLTGIVVLKYTKTGKAAWPEPTRWDPYQDGFSVVDLALDGKGDVYVAGSMSYDGFTTAVIWKTRGSDGAKSGGWHYEPLHGDSSSFRVLTVRGSSVVATGAVWTESVDKSRNALVVKLDRDLREKARREWGVGNKDEEFWEAVVDGKGNVFVTGGQWVMKYAKAVTMKLDAKLKTVWSKTYMPASRYALGQYIARDGAGNIYVGGYEDFSPVQPAKSLLTIKYSAAGARKWVRAWSGSKWSNPSGLVLGSRGGVYVAGDVWNKQGIYQAVLLKYRR